MLEQLFGSKTRVKLLKLFLNNPKKAFFVREIARRLKTQLNSVRREIAILEKIGLIRSHHEAKAAITNQKKRSGKSVKKFYITNSDNPLFPELKALFLKSQLVSEDSLLNQIKKHANLQLLILTGIFVGMSESPVDILLVGTVNRKSLASIINRFEKELNHEIKYWVLSRSEFKYRNDITDRFLYEILEGEKLIIENSV